MSIEILQNIRVVLIGTLKSGNLGSVARAMENCGFTELVLVNPEAKVDRHARAMAIKAIGTLNGAKVVSSVEKALEGSLFAVGFVGCRDKRPKVLEDYYGVLPEIIASAKERVISFVFGREDFGLNKETMDRCRHLVMIPTHPKYESLNLSHAVLLAGHAVLRGVLDFQLRKPIPFKSLDDEASFEHREGFYRDLERILGLTGFFADERARPATMRKFRAIVERSRPSHREIQLLRGVCRQIQWAVHNGPHASAKDLLLPTSPWPS